MALQFDIRYPISVPYGVLRLVALIVCFIIMICMASYDIYPAGSGFMWFTVSGASITTSIFIILYTIHFPDTFPKLRFTVIEMSISAIWVVFFAGSFIAACVFANKNWSGIAAPYGAAAFFCIINMLVFGLLTFLFVKLWRSGPVAVIHTTTSTTVTSSSSTGGRF